MMEPNALMNLNEESEVIFSFITLPYVCQRRFAEICDGKTLKVFALISSVTRNLSKRCHTIEQIKIDYSYSVVSPIITFRCFCDKDEFCRGVNETRISAFKSKFEVLDKINLTNLGDTKTDDHFLHSLPFSFNSVQRLELRCNSINLTDLKPLIGPEIKTLYFYGGIRTECSLEEFMNFIKCLSRLHICQ